MGQGECAAQGQSVYLLYPGDGALLHKMQHTVQVIRWTPGQAQFALSHGGALGLPAVLAQPGWVHPVMLHKRGIEAAQAGKTGGQRYLLHRHARVGQQLLGHQQALGAQPGNRCHPMGFDKDAAQVPIGHAQAGGQIRHGRVIALVGRLGQPAGRLGGQHFRRVVQRQARRQLGPAAQAGAKAAGLGLRSLAEKPAVLRARRPHLAHRPAVDAGGGDTDKQPPVKPRVTGAQHLVGGIVLQGATGCGQIQVGCKAAGHDTMIDSAAPRAGRFRTCAWRRGPLGLAHG